MTMGGWQKNLNGFIAAVQSNDTDRGTDAVESMVLDLVQGEGRTLTDALVFIGVLAVAAKLDDRTSLERLAGVGPERWGQRPAPTAPAVTVCQRCSAEWLAERFKELPAEGGCPACLPEGGAWERRLGADGDFLHAFWTKEPHQLFIYTQFRSSFMQLGPPSRTMKGTAVFAGPRVLVGSTHWGSVHARPVRSPKNHVFWVLDPDGSMLGSDIDAIRRDFETGDEKILLEQLKGAAAQAAAAERIGADEFWRALGQA
jgi:hypothetical protein